MLHIAGINPWLMMWSQPRSTIRAIVHNKPTYGVYYLSAIYLLECLFYYANWWSLGLKVSSYAVFLAGLLSSPFVGFMWVYFVGGIFYLTGRLFKGKASALHLRAALAWSKLPMILSLFMWLILLFIDPEFVFIQNGKEPSSLFINFITLILVIWSFVLLVQAIREVQQFSMGRAIANVVFSLLLSRALLFVFSLLTRYIYTEII